VSTNPRRPYPRDLEENRCLRIPEAAAFLGIAPKTVYDLMKDGSLPYTRVRTERRIEKSALRAYVAARRVERRP
jgi:excisionase family DNA binding protein